MADPVPEAAGQQTQGARGGRGQHGPQGDDADVDAAYAADDGGITVRIAHLRIAHWGAILRWAILSPSVIRIAHLNYYVFVCLFMLDMGPG